MQRNDQPPEFTFRRPDIIGHADAESDGIFLGQCFVDNGVAEILLNCSDPRKIIVGRTGTGKTALLNRVKNYAGQRAIEIRPENLALSYISNSTILLFLSSIGVRLDIFFKLLWRHVLVVELLKVHFHIHNEEQKRGFISRLFDRFKSDKHKQSIRYLEEWGRSFWEETEYRVKEVTTKLENDVEATIKAKVPGFRAEAGATGARRFSEEEVKEIVQRAQVVVNKVQIKQLSDILELLNEVLDDEQKPYYIIIDRLDENWVDDNVRYRLIRGLIETARDFSAIKNTKVILALRLDLYERVFREARDSGYQEEKYQSSCLRLEWSRPSLEKMLDSRIGHLVRNRYKKSAVISHKDILPKAVGKALVIDYMIDRTLERPRDLIQFINRCIQQAEGQPRITERMLVKGEAEYSAAFIRSLSDEWHDDYPNFPVFVQLLNTMPPKFKLSELSNDKVQDLCLNHCAHSDQAKPDKFSEAASRLSHGQISHEEFRRVWCYNVFIVGIVGVKTNGYEKFQFSTGVRTLPQQEINDDTMVSIRAGVWRALGIRNRSGDS